MVNSSHNYIVIGGGIVGSVVASRLHGIRPHLSILLLEAGPDVTEHPLIPDGRNFQRLLGSELDWSCVTVPQMHLNNRVCPMLLGKL